MRAVTDDPYFQMYYIPRYFYRRLFVQRAPKYQWQRRAVAVDHAWCCTPREKKKGERTERRKESGRWRKRRWWKRETRETEGGRETERENAVTGDERSGEKKKKRWLRQHSALRRIYIYVSPRDVGLSSCPMMDVYHVRQRPRHLLHRRRRRLLLFLLSTSSSSSHTLPVSRRAVRRYRTNFSRVGFSFLERNASFRARDRLNLAEKEATSGTSAPLAERSRGAVFLG